MEVLWRCPLAIAQRLVHSAIALSTAVLDRVTKTMSVAPLLMNNLDNSKQKTSNLLSPAPPPYSWSLLGKSEGPAPPPSSKISWSFDLAWNPDTSSSLLPWYNRTVGWLGVKHQVTYSSSLTSQLSSVTKKRERENFFSLFLFHINIVIFSPWNWLTGR